MNTLTVEFHGICTHFFRAAHPDELRREHRVVLVKATPSTEVRTVHIGSHVASMQLNGGQVPLDGVHLTLEMLDGAVPPPFVRDPSIFQLPMLTQLMDGLETLSPPSPIVFGVPAGQVACYFDFSLGTLSAFVTGTNAAFARLHAQSEHDFVLKATPLDENPLPQGLQSETRLAGDTTIVVSNTDDDPAEKVAADFLLHYKTAARMPMVPQIPQLPTLQVLPLQAPTIITTIGAGCSNSNYP
ncbi:MAG TPA: hypothetical protein VEO54_20740 [Thermoanaerobaculia bacterium]|nr:hypothetical protein [Thermoanaerobaculia bacterium]